MKNLTQAMIDAALDFLPANMAVEVLTKIYDDSHQNMIEQELIALAEIVAGLRERINTDMDAIMEEITSSFSPEELDELKNFEKFFEQVDIQNAYEEGWNEQSKFYKPLYRQAYLELKGVL